MTYGTIQKWDEYFFWGVYFIKGCQPFAHIMDILAEC